MRARLESTLMAARRLPWFLLPLAIFIGITVLIFVGDLRQPRDLHAVRGALDLSGRDLSVPVMLRGEWEYYPGALLQDAASLRPGAYVRLPHRFDRDPSVGLRLFGKPLFGGRPYGFASYALRVEGLVPGRTYAAGVLTQSTAYLLRANGQPILAAGRVGRDAATHEPEFKEKVGTFTADAAGRARLDIEISNFSYNIGGFWNPVMIGEVPAVLHQTGRQDLLETFLFTAYFVSAMLFMGLFAANTEFRPLLNFTIVCVLMAVRTLLTNQRQFYDLIGPLSWEASVRIEFLSGYLLLPALLLFFHRLQFTDRPRWMPGFSLGFAALMGAVALFGPPEVYQDLLTPFMRLCLASLPYFSYCLWRGIRTRRFEAISILISFIVVLPALFYDFYGGGMYSLLPVGIYFMIVGFGVTVIVRLSELKKTHDHLRVAITEDALTGLNNRLYLDSLVDAGIEVRPGHHLYVLFFDLDRFKHYNDTLGHKVGDLILKEAAARLRSCFRGSDTLCRYGGDEFVALAEIDASSGCIGDITERIRLRFDPPAIIAGSAISIGVSVGVAEYRAGEDLDRTIKAADGAMYADKAARNDSRSPRPAAGHAPPAAITGG